MDECNRAHEFVVGACKNVGEILLKAEVSLPSKSRKAIRWDTARVNNSSLLGSTTALERLDRSSHLFESPSLRFAIRVQPAALIEQPCAGDAAKTRAR